VHAFRKLWLRYFHASNASKVLKDAKLVYQEHYERWVECTERGIGSHIVGWQKSQRDQSGPPENTTLIVGICTHEGPRTKEPI
jgi:hypothetical protein